jgi:putative endonuclease
MFYLYIIYSAKLDKYYINYTENVEIRLQQHNSGISNFTSKASDWVCLYHEIFNTREEAMARERYMKSMKRRNYIEALIKSST